MHFGKHKPCLLWVPDQVVDPVFRVGGGGGGGGGGGRKAVCNSGQGDWQWQDWIRLFPS